MYSQLHFCGGNVKGPSEPEVTEDVEADNTGSSTDMFEYRNGFWSNYGQKGNYE